MLLRSRSIATPAQCIREGRPGECLKPPRNESMPLLGMLRLRTSVASRRTFYAQHDMEKLEGAIEFDDSEATEKIKPTHCAV